MNTEIDPKTNELVAVEGYAGSEYQKIGLFWGNFLYIFRAGMGDFSLYGASIFLKSSENYIFWGLFFLVLIATNVVFLNFVIAEAGNSYNRVKESLKEFNLKESAQLIDEAEHMIPRMFRSQKLFPKYIIYRSVDE